jgi:hypothetical protein
LQDALTEGLGASTEWVWCEIEWTRSFRGSEFDARPLTPGAANSLPRSPTFQWRDDQPPPETHAPARVAHEELIRSLISAGWEPVGAADSWYAERFRRKVVEVQIEAERLRARARPRIASSPRQAMHKPADMKQLPREAKAEQVGVEQAPRQATDDQVDVEQVPRQPREEPVGVEQVHREATRERSLESASPPSPAAEEPLETELAEGQAAEEPTKVERVSRQPQGEQPPVEPIASSWAARIGIAALTVASLAILGFVGLVLLGFFR